MLSGLCSGLRWRLCAAEKRRVIGPRA